MFPLRYRAEILLTGVTVILVGVILLFNDINIQIRMREMKLFLQRSNRSDNSIDHIGLVMKYRLHKEMYENRITQENMNIIEVRINSILSGMEHEKNITRDKYRYISIPVIYVINFIRYLVGMPRLREGGTWTVNEDIEIAYYYERNKLYPKAIEVYQRILDRGASDRTLRAGVLLHQGYCHSILGDYSEAKKLYLSVIKNYGDINVAVTAAMLLRYIEGFRSEIDRVIKLEKDSVEKGEKLYKLIAYRESLDVLTRVENSVPAGEKSRIRFFKGRTLEELGDTEKAVDIYQKIVMDDSSSGYAKDANRRIYIVGGAALGGEKIRDLAAKNSMMLNDGVFAKLVEESAKYSIEEKSDTEAIIKEAIRIDPEEQRPAGIVKEKKIEMMIRKVDERIAGETGRSGSRSDILPENRMVKIYTSDGNIFTGTVVSDTGGMVVIRTSLGDIKIEKSKISRRINL